jgi:hypothetical protein
MVLVTAATPPVRGDSARSRGSKSIRKESSGFRRFAEPSDGLEPSTPPYHLGSVASGGNRWRRLASNRAAFVALPFAQLRAFASALLHKCSTSVRGSGRIGAACADRSLWRIEQGCFLDLARLKRAVQENRPGRIAVMVSVSVLDPGVVCEMGLSLFRCCRIDDEQDVLLIERSAEQDDTLDDEIVDKLCVLREQRLFGEALRPVPRATVLLVDRNNSRIDASFTSPA